MYRHTMPAALNEPEVPRRVTKPSWAMRREEYEHGSVRARLSLADSPTFTEPSASTHQPRALAMRANGWHNYGAGELLRPGPAKLTYRPLECLI